MDRLEVRLTRSDGLLARGPFHATYSYDAPTPWAAGRLQLRAKRRGRGALGKLLDNEVDDRKARALNLI